MIPVSLSWVTEQVQGKLLDESQAELIIAGVSTDTRQIQSGDLFIALQGPNFDGHKFVQQAKDAGATAAIVVTPLDMDFPQIVVEDTKLALGALAAGVKASVAPLTVGITGSSGKTTVKEMVAAILSRRGKVLATKGNFNNDIGVPLTLLRLEHDHDYAVVEMGANHLGEIAYTTNLVKPDVATIVNAAAAHLEGFGSLLGVARAKSEIFKGLPGHGLAVLNADSQFHDFWKSKLRLSKIQSFSIESPTDFYAEDTILGLDGCAQFDLVSPQGRVSVSLSLPGLHNVGNALVAAALAMGVGASLHDVAEGLRFMPHVAGRLHVKQLTNQVKILDDTYNANVASVNAAIDLLSSFAGRRILVLGDMAELGEKSRYYHEQVGEYAKQKGIDQLYTLGVLSQSASMVFAGQGKHFSNLAALNDFMLSQLAGEQRDITILVKGSRSAKMERVVAALEQSDLGKFERVRERIAC
ncbi:UDP-N-acetylmuramoyl-tripeptide--D-alanyl-D-alanine ligase [Paraglaciecola hydrolytica]|uniref:UDP-N-acetylmuramoyl-tripeptide--D-alanyl-D-alanine ligase n=1 Tax=Paraglaciecola hydrolytica TaxID=1799789 RepID=A0A136A6N7_9ALTE|nr:UDP-N-acetylmuramoyl-tripeptide--D-alanyl-D-alanine ligase [Paraglaciecola hydrolytica]KXI30905.1 UDP-N-acetylmuramoyl-tripeptide--D-alanyl-D-alanine ligase [Paraglaciecola hydrolytica]